MEILNTSSNKQKHTTSGTNGGSKYYKQALIDTGTCFKEAQNQPNNTQLLSSFQLASKLKKINQNLDNSSFLAHHHQDHLLNSSHLNASPGSLNNTFSIFSMTSPSCISVDTSLNNNHLNDQESGYHHNKHLPHQIYDHHYNPKTSSSISSGKTWVTAFGLFYGQLHLLLAMNQMNSFDD